MHNIFVYSLPRSGTNFFSAYLHLHDQLGAVNAQRYFLAGSFFDSPRSYPILRGAGTKKNWVKSAFSNLLALPFKTWSLVQLYLGMPRPWV